MEGEFHPVAVMRVDVEVEDVRQPLLEPAQQPEHRIVQVAEARRAIRHTVMRAPARHMHRPAFRRQPRGQHGPTRTGRGAPEDLAVDRVAMGADVMPRAGLRSHGLLGLGADQGFDVLCRVEACQLGGRRHRAVLILARRHPAHRPDQVERGRDARDRQRVLRAIGRAPVDLGANQHGTGHGAEMPRPATLASLTRARHGTVTHRGEPIGG